MKNSSVLHVLLFLVAISNSHGQAIGTCGGGYAKAQIEGENIRAQFNNRGDFYWEPDSGKSRFEWPKNSSNGNSLIFAGGLWFGGLDKSTGTSKFNVAVQTYRGPLQNLWPGPVPYANSAPSPACCQFWDRVFCVTRAEIDTFFDNLNILPFPPHIPDAVLYWPGHGNPYLKGLASTLDSQTIKSIDGKGAPFIDVDGNGIYYPPMGDYPDIQNKLSMCYEVINDIGNTKNFQDNSMAIAGAGLEFHLLFSTYPSNSNAHYLANSIFTDITVYNKGGITMDSAYIGLWLDPNGRYKQSDVMRNMGIAFGKTTFDSGIDYAPAIGFKALDGPHSPPNDMVDNNRNGVVDEPNEKGLFSSFTLYNNSWSPINGEPTKAPDFYNYLRSRWKNGAKITYGLDASNPACRFMVPGASDPVGYGMGGTPQNPVSKPSWTMLENSVFIGPQRMIMAAGPFTLQPGDVEKYSYVNLIGFGGDSAQNLHTLELISDSLDSYLPILTSIKKQSHSADFHIQVSPNPSAGSLLIQAEATIKKIEIRDVVGRQVLTQMPGKASTILRLDQFVKGLYNISVYTEKGTKTVRILLE